MNCSIDCFKKNKHLPENRVRYDKNKHKSLKWITNCILKSINTKYRMYKKLLRAKISNSESYAILKAEFKAYQSSLRRSIKEAKRLYYIKVFNMYKNDIKQTWVPSPRYNNDRRRLNMYQFCILYFIIITLIEITIIAMFTFV